MAPTERRSSAKPIAPPKRVARITPFHRLPKKLKARTSAPSHARAECSTAMPGVVAVVPGVVAVVLTVVAVVPAPVAVVPAPVAVVLAPLAAVLAPLAVVSAVLPGEVSVVMAAESTTLPVMVPSATPGEVRATASLTGIASAYPIGARFFDVASFLLATSDGCRTIQIGSTVTNLLNTDTASTAPARRSRLADDALSALFVDARTARTFAPTPVTDAELTAIWDLAKWAPTASNLQPLRVMYVQNPEARARLVAHMAEGNRARIASAPAVAVLAVDSRFHEYVPMVMPLRPELQDALEGNDAMRAKMGGFSGAMQAGYFVLAVRAQGLAAGPMGGFDAQAVDADFFPDGRLHSALVVAIGHPGENPWHDRLPRLENTDAVIWA